jgi:hypothetical protein
LPTGILILVIPTAILAGLLLGLWIRWWAIPVVGVGWAVVIAFVDPSAALAGAALGSVNAAVGAAAAVGLCGLVTRVRPRSERR